MRQNLIAEKTFQFSLDIIELYSHLKKNNEFILSKQLLKSATSIGANIEEALGGISKKEFIAKMSISQKEARETHYWLRLLDKSQIVEYNYSSYLNEAEQIINILTSIVKTSQKNYNNS